MFCALEEKSAERAVRDAHDALRAGELEQFGVLEVRMTLALMNTERED